MKDNLLLSLYVILCSMISQTISTTPDTCGVGCLTCIKGFCQECMDDYELSQDGLATCFYQGCSKNLYFQEPVYQQSGDFSEAECTSVCQEGYISDNSSGICQMLFPCSKQFSLYTGISSNENIKELRDLDEVNMIVVYSRSISLINKEQGYLVWSIEFPNEAVFSQIFRRYLYYFQRDRLVVQTDIFTGQKQVLNLNSSIDFDEKTKLIELSSQHGAILIQDKNTTQYIITLCIDSSNSTFLAKINPQHSITLPDTALLNGSLVLLKNKENKSISISILIPSSVKLERKVIIDSPCSSTLNSFYPTSFLSLDDRFSRFLLISSSSYAYLVEQLNSTVSCTKIDLTETPLQIQQTSAFIFVRLSTNILAINAATLELLPKIQLTSSSLPVDFVVSESDGIHSLAILDDAFILSFYIQTQIGSSFGYVDSQNFAMFRPKSLFLTSENKTLLPQTSDSAWQFQYEYPMIVFAYGMNINGAFFRQTGSATNLALSNFRKTYSGFVGGVAQMKYISSSSILVACSGIGELMVWDFSVYALKLLLLEYIDLGQFGKCNDIKELTSLSVIVLFDKTAIIFDLLKLKITKTLEFINPQDSTSNTNTSLSNSDKNYKLIARSKSYAAYISNSCLSILSNSDAQEMQFCSSQFESDDSPMRFYFEEDRFLILQRSHSVEVYEIAINLELQSIRILSKTTHSSGDARKLIYSKIRLFPIDYQLANDICFEVLIFTSDHSFQIFNERLQLLFIQENILLSSILDLSFVESDPTEIFYFLLGPSSVKTSTFPYSAFCIVKGKNLIYPVLQLVGVQSFLSITKQLPPANSKPDSYNYAVSYDIKVIMVLSYLSVVEIFYWSVENPNNYVAQVFVQNTNLFSATEFMKRDQFYLTGNQRGLLQFGNFRNQVHSHVKPLSEEEQPPSDIFLKVEQSIFMGRFFAIKSNIVVYDLFSFKIVETIEVSRDPMSPIQQFSKIESASSFLALKNNVILMHRFLDGSSAEYFVKNQGESTESYEQFWFNKTNLAISGFIISEDLLQVYAFGDSIFLLDFKLVVLKSQELESTVTNCSLAGDILFCTDINSSVVQINKNTLQTIKVFAAKQDENAALGIAIDSDNQQIFLYGNAVEIFSYQGSLLSKVPVYMGAVQSLNFYGDAVVFSNPGSVQVLSRGTLAYRGVLYSPGAGILRKIIYIEEYNHIVLFSNSVRFAQVFSYYLDDLSLFAQFKNSYPQNEITQCADIYFDRTQNMLVTLDYTGNILVFTYYGSLTSIGLNKIIEFNSKSNQIVQGLSVDPNTNTLLVFSQTDIIVVDSGQLIYVLQSLPTQTSSFYTMAPSAETQYYYNLYFLFDNSNIIYTLYSNNLQYFYHFNEEIKAILFLESTQALVVALKNKIVLFPKALLDNHTEATKNQELQIDQDIQFYQFVGADMLLCHHNILVLFSFNLTRVVELPIGDSRVTTSLILDANSVLFGTSSGMIIKFNKSQLTSQVLDLQASSHALGLKSQSAIAHLLKIDITKDNFQGDILACFTEIFGIYLINSQTLQATLFINVSSIEPFLENTQIGQPLLVSIFQADVLQRFLFLSFMTEKVIRVFNIDTGSLVGYLPAPVRSKLRIHLTDSFLIIYSAGQLNIFSRQTLRFQKAILRQGIDEVVDVNVVNDQFFLIISTKKYELFYFEDGELQFIDQIFVDSPVLLEASIQQNNYEPKDIFYSGDKILLVTLVAGDRVIQESYSLDYELSTESKKICSMKIYAETLQQMKQTLSEIKPSQVPDSLWINFTPATDDQRNNALMVMLINSDLTSINFESTKDNQITMFPFPNDNSTTSRYSTLYIKVQSLALFAKEKMYMRDFILQFPETGLILFSELTTVVHFQNLLVQDTDLTGISLLFRDMDEIVISNLSIRNVTRSASSRSLEDFWIRVEDCMELYIYDLVITADSGDETDTLPQNLQLKNLISVNTVMKVYIKNLTISGYAPHQLIYLTQIDELSIESLTITNCFIPTAEAASLELAVLSIVGVHNTTLRNFSMTRCSCYQFFSTSNIFMDNYHKIQLRFDTLVIEGLQIESSTSPKAISNSLVALQSSQIAMVGIQFVNNQGNILVVSCYTASVRDSNFINNVSQNGGALAFISCSQNVSIASSQFSNNKAYGSGGAIYFENIRVNMIQMDLFSTRVFSNFALIGGGIRIKTQDDNSVESAFEKFKLAVSGNTAELYGNNLATFPCEIEMEFIHSNSLNSANQKPSDNSNIFRVRKKQNLTASESAQFDQIGEIFEFMSGSSMILRFKLIDEERRLLSFSNLKLRQQQYPADIAHELNIIQFKMIAEDPNEVLISGQSLITNEQYQENLQSLAFKDALVTGLPSTTKNILIEYKISMKNEINPTQVLLKVSFRDCIIGEEIKLITLGIASCFPCPYGFYSLDDPMIDFKNTSNFSVQQCRKCPESANYCQNNTISLKEGYWRSDTKSTEIIECEMNPIACTPQSPESQLGCSMGYIGPTCRECDLNGIVWKGSAYTHNLSNPIICEKCSSAEYQAVYVVVAFLGLSIYFLISLALFMNSFTHSLICFYLRILKIAPISKSSIKDQSTFYLKVLINYFQISSLVVVLGVHSILPVFFISLPNFFGSPSNQLVLGVACLLSTSQISEKSTQSNDLLPDQLQNIQQNQISHALIPFIFAGLLLGLVSIAERVKSWKVSSSQKYTLMNFIFVFFQPDQIKYFSQQISCIKIGSKDYVTSNLLIPCNYPEYNSFTYALSIPLLLFWQLAPLFTLYSLKRRSKTLQTCQTLYRYGFFYSEFKNKYFYWDFIRIYLRVFVVGLSNLLGQNMAANQLIVLVLCLYTLLTSQKSPFFSQSLQKIEVTACKVLIINVVLSSINIQYHSSAISAVIFCIHSCFIISTISLIAFFKLSNPLTLPGHALRLVLQKFLPKSLFLKYARYVQIDIKTWRYWRMVSKNIPLIIGASAMKKISKVQTSCSGKQLKYINVSESIIQSPKQTPLHSPENNAQSAQNILCSLGPQNCNNIVANNSSSIMDNQLFSCKNSNNNKSILLNGNLNNSGSFLKQIKYVKASQTNYRHYLRASSFQDRQNNAEQIASIKSEILPESKNLSISSEQTSSCPPSPPELINCNEDSIIQEDEFLEQATFRNSSNNASKLEELYDKKCNNKLRLEMSLTPK